jgi:hypothetical protein
MPMRLYLISDYFGAVPRGVCDRFVGFRERRQSGPTRSFISLWGDEQRQPNVQGSLFARAHRKTTTGQ